MDWPASDSKRRRLRCMRAERSFAPRKLSQMPACINVRAYARTGSQPLGKGSGIAKRPRVFTVGLWTCDLSNIPNPPTSTFRGQAARSQSHGNCQSST